MLSEPVKKEVAVIVFAHLVNENVLHILKQLGEIDSVVDLYVVGYSESKSDSSIYAAIQGAQVVQLDKSDVLSLEYGASYDLVKDWKTLRGRWDYPLLAFYSKFNGYKKYWVIEYDVLYTGNWANLVQLLESESEADLLGAYVTRRGSFDAWVHWKDFVTPGVEQVSHTRCFLPFCRASNRLLRRVHEAYKSGWSGHAEAIWPTVALSDGMDIEEIGGTGTWTPSSRKGKYYHAFNSKDGFFLATFQARPTYHLDRGFFYSSSPPNILWHPVK